MASNSKPLLDQRWPRLLRALETEVSLCARCPRLVAWREEVARLKRRAYADCTYWGRPVPSFGDPNARLLVIGLAPGAHGANRTGRMFTGDRSGEFLYRALYETGFANQPASVHRDDGLQLTDAFLTAPVRCVPPDNKPERDEVVNCRPYFTACLDSLQRVRVVVALGGFGFAEYLTYLRTKGRIDRIASFKFGHDTAYRTYEGGPWLLGSYHPSQQNTSTGKLDAGMLRGIFERARRLMAEPAGSLGT